MDRLRSPGGCPWDAEQTHESLVKYLIEESHEAAEAIESGDRDHIREELGDVLLQVVFQSRVTQEHPTEPFDVDDVAGPSSRSWSGGIPHVFADGDASTPAEVEQAWEQIKAAERAAKPPHGGGEDGHQGCCTAYPGRCPACSSPTRCWRAGSAPVVTCPPWVTLRETSGPELLALVADARREGVSAEEVLRQALRDLDQEAQTGSNGRSGR